jgi:heptaprenyl diphosphate synthase
MPSASDPGRGAAELDIIALLAALALMLSSIEYIIPKPVPFLRLGLANLPVLISLSLLAPRRVFLLVLLKVTGQALIQGSFLSIALLFSAAGSFASAAVMLAVRRLCGRRVSLIGISILGALASNSVQLLLARLLVFGSYAWLIAPLFLFLGLGSSTLLGLVAETYLQRSRWLSSLQAARTGRRVP